MKVFFPVAGVETYFFIPPLVAFIISFFTSMGGVTGAFLILPFQMSVLGFTAPSVSATNFLYNIVGTPGGLWRYIHEQRMVWPLAAWITAGTLPGVLAGYYIRVTFLPDPKIFKFFVGTVLLYLGVRLLRSLGAKSLKPTGQAAESFAISAVTCDWRSIAYSFRGEQFSCSVAAIFLLALMVGIIGGIYGIGGGAIIAPFCVSILRLPVYTVAAAAMMGTFATSVVGVLFYSSIPLNNGLTAPPDWLLGILFGLGGLAGMYLGARCQRYMPERVIKGILALVILAVSIRYIGQFFA